MIGVFAAWQRGYFSNDQDVSCKTFGDTALTVVAGPLNYIGANPKIDCKVPAAVEVTGTLRSRGAA